MKAFIFLTIESVLTSVSTSKNISDQHPIKSISFKLLLYYIKYLETRRVDSPVIMRIQIRARGDLRACFPDFFFIEMVRGAFWVFRSTFFNSFKDNFPQ